MKTKSKIIILCSVVCSLLLFGCGLGQLLTPTPTATQTVIPTSTLTPTPAPTPTPIAPWIEGQVNLVREGASTPIENALIELVDALGPKYHRTTALTNESGKYVIEDLQPGSYGLHVVLSPERYKTKTAFGPLECNVPNGLVIMTSQQDEVLFFSASQTGEGYTIFEATGYQVQIVKIEGIRKDLEMHCE